MIRSDLTSATIGVVASMLIAGCSSALDPVQQLAAANRAVDEWVARHPTEWAASVSGERTLFRPEFSTSCSQGGKNNLVALTYASGDTEIDFYFTCPLGPTASIEELRSAFAFVVLTRLPHGVRVPGWTFVLRTPTSSVEEAVTFEPAASGSIRIGIDTPLYAISGRSLDPSCQGPLDAPASAECYVTREHAIPLRVTLRARLDGSELQ